MRNRGHTLIETAAVVVVVLALLALAAPTLAQPRRAARFQTSQDNLRFWGAGASAYVMDSGGELPTYTWEPGRVYHVEGLGEIFINGPWLQAHSWQETDLLRRLTGRVEGETRIRRAQSIYPQRRRLHLIIAEYLGIGVTDRRAADPQDRNQLVWQRDPIAFEENGPYPEAGIGEEPQFMSDPAVIQRWPYTSSYHAVPASYAFDRAPGAQTTLGPVGNTCNLFSNSSAPIPTRQAGDVAFPAHKVYMFEWHDRHSAAQDLWYAYPQARSNKLLFDGSVHDRPTGEAGGGFDPNDPDDPGAFYYFYTPLTTDPPVPNGAPGKAAVSYRFTRDGLAGIDYAP